MGNFYSKITLVKQLDKKVNEDVVVDVPLVVSVAGAGSPSQVLPSPATEQLPSKVPVGEGDVVAPKVSVREGLGKLAEMFGGRQVTLDQNIHDLNTVDDSLGMKTEVRDPSASSVWQLVGKLALSRGYSRTGAVFADFNKFSKVDMVSFDRKGRREMERIFTSRQGVADGMVDEDSSARDKLIGKRVSR